MPVTISDEILQQTGMNERQALIEIACCLFAAGKISLPLAGRLAGLSRGAMEDELLDRNIPLYRPGIDDYAQDIETLREFRETK